MCVGCTWGKCVKPNSCECSDGYRWSSNEIQCIPICEPNCQKCVAPNKCDCDEHHNYNVELDLCEPKCEKACVNGTCVAGNKCECNKDYKFKSGSGNECEPICKPNCENGSCIAPNTCECNSDYHFKINSSTECEQVNAYTTEKLLNYTSEQPNLRESLPTSTEWDFFVSYFHPYLCVIIFPYFFSYITQHSFIPIWYYYRTSVQHNRQLLKLISIWNLHFNHVTTLSKIHAHFSLCC